MSPRVEFLQLENVKVDPIVQRRLDKQWVKKTAASWDDDKLGLLTVSRRTDGDYMIDGQHRRACLMLLGRGDERFPMIVEEFSGVDSEAKSFVARNAEGRKPQPLDVYRVKLVAKDPATVEIDQLLSRFELRVEYGAGDGSVAAVTAIYAIHRKGGAPLLGEIIQIVQATWGTDRFAYDGTILNGLALILSKRDMAIDPNELATKLSKAYTPARLMAQARSYRAARMQPLTRAMAEVMLDTYNRGRRTRRVEL